MVHPLISFFIVRSTVLNYLKDPLQQTNITQLHLSSATFVISLVIFLIEGLTPDKIPHNEEDPSSGVQPNPELGTCLLSRLTFYYMNAFIWKCQLTSTSAPMSLDEIPALTHDEGVAKNLLEFRQTVETLNQGRENPRSLTATVFWHFRYQIVEAGIWAALRSITIVIPPLLMGKLLHEISRTASGKSDVPFHVLLLYAAGIFFVQQVSVITIGQASYIGTKLKIRISGLLTAEICSKIQRKKVSDQGQGKIVNFISVETNNVGQFVGFLYVLWPEQPLTAAISLGLLFLMIGWSALAGVAFLILISFLQGYLVKLLYPIQKEIQKASDVRVGLMTELVGSIRLIKYYAWEHNFLGKLDKARQAELDLIWSKAKIVVIQGVTFAATPALTAVSGTGLFKFLAIR